MPAPAPAPAPARLRTSEPAFPGARPGWDGGTNVAGGSTAPFGIDVTVPSTARMYDFWLGGKDNYAVDRAAALEVSKAAPDVQMTATENRRFLRRAVRYLAAEAGIAQFLDIGTGLPTQGNVHQVAQQLNPDARVVYADNDPSLTVLGTVT
jgi:S-adenosyl methyltransferase